MAAGIRTFDDDKVYEKWQVVEAGLASFVAEMKAQGVWENVTVTMGSEFGRTLDSNGAGTDHGWGGNTFVMGGAVSGGHIIGKYPSDLSHNSDIRLHQDNDSDHGLEGTWNALAQWMGVEDEAMANVLPTSTSSARSTPWLPGMWYHHRGMMFKGSTAESAARLTTQPTAITAKDATAATCYAQRSAFTSTPGWRDLLSSAWFHLEPTP